MRFRIFIGSLLCGFMLFGYAQSQQASFRQSQERYSRFRTALAEKDSLLRKLFRKHRVDYPPAKIYVRVFKAERTVELWARSSHVDTLALVKTYRICAVSGTPGPKRAQGDLQIPEGFYHIDRFNPSSNFYLSLRINYPNPSDRVLGTRGRLGGDIFIHGSCVTIGCVPITDEKIKELYLVAVEARSNGQQRIPVHIFPNRMGAVGLGELKRRFKHKPNLVSFWENLKQGFDLFEATHRVPKVQVEQKSARYLFSR